MNAYLLFAKEVRVAFLKENPSASQEDVDRLVHTKWRHVLTSEEKRPYFDRAEKLRRDAANKQQRKRERARLAAATSAAAGLTHGEASDASEKKDQAPDSEGDARSAPSSPDSGCPSTPDGSDASTISPVAPLRQHKKPTGKTFGNKVPFGHRISSRPEAYPIPSSHFSVGIPIAGQQIAFPPIVPHMIPHPAFPLPYMHPYYFPPSMMQSYFAAHGVGQIGYPTSVPSNAPVYGNSMGGPMLPPNPYYGMPMYAPQPFYQQHRASAAAGCCSATASNPNPTFSSTLEEFASDKGGFADLTVNDDSGKSDCGLFDDSYGHAGERVACVDVERIGSS